MTENKQRKYSRAILIEEEEIKSDLFPHINKKNAKHDTFKYYYYNMDVA